MLFSYTIKVTTMSKYLQDVVLPYFETYRNSNLDICLFNLNGDLLDCSELAAKNVGLTRLECININYNNLSTDAIKKLCHVRDAIDVELISQIFKLISKLQQIVIREQRMINYIDFVPYKSYSTIEMVSTTPIFEPTGQVIAIQATSSRKHLFSGALDYIDYFSNEKNKFRTLRSKKTGLNISPRQHEIIFLLSYKMSQIDISNLLNISRSTVSKIIERLCNRFEIEGININKLLEHAKNIRLNEYIPESLMRPRIIVLDNEIQNSYSKTQLTK